MVKLFKVRKNLDKKQILNIVFDTYGSLTNFGFKQKGSTAVARELNLSVKTVHTLLKRLERFNFNVEALFVN